MQPNITVQEAKLAHRQLEADIAKLLNDFSSNTGFVVSSVYKQDSFKISKDVPDYIVKVEIKL